MSYRLTKRLASVFICISMLWTTGCKQKTNKPGTRKAKLIAKKASKNESRVLPRKKDTKIAKPSTKGKVQPAKRAAASTKSKRAKRKVARLNKRKAPTFRVIQPKGLGKLRLPKGGLKIKTLPRVAPANRVGKIIIPSAKVELGKVKKAKPAKRRPHPPIVITKKYPKGCQIDFRVLGMT